MNYTAMGIVLTTKCGANCEMLCAANCETLCAANCSLCGARSCVGKMVPEPYGG